MHGERLGAYYAEGFKIGVLIGLEIAGNSEEE